MPSANYLESGSELKIKLELAYPLRTISEIEANSITENPKEVRYNLWYMV